MTVRFYLPPPDLRPFFTTFYLTEIDVGGGPPIEDMLHPEWANLRFIKGQRPTASIGDSQVVGDTDFLASGPTMHAVTFSIGTASSWGVGIMPLGWAQVVRQPADRYGDRIVDGMTDPGFADFRRLAAEIAACHDDVPAVLAALTHFFRERAAQPLPDAERIAAVHAALVDPAVHSVVDLARRVNIQPRTLERLCCRHFGFSPKTLLRRQRFMRSVAHFLVEPHGNWIDALDDHYCDQSQFVHEFREFMGMSPREYAARPHPIMDRFVRERMRFSGSAVQATDLPA